MNPIAVCIPSIGRSGKMLDDIIELAKAEPGVEKVVVYDNSDDNTCLRSTKHRPGKTIYQEFNEFAEDWNWKAHCAFLNDDIELAPGTLTALATELSGNSDLGLISVDRDNTQARCEPRRVRRTSGTVRQNGVNSWVFMVKLGHWRRIDERFQVWYGDDDLCWKIEQAGKRVAVLEGVSAKHEWSMTLNTIPQVGEKQAADGRLWHGELGRP